MRAAPPVSYPLGPCFFQRAVYVAMAVLATVVWWAWALSKALKRRKVCWPCSCWA